MQNIGIWGLGVYLPEGVRRNEDFPPEAVAAWRQKAAKRLERILAQFESEQSEGARVALEALVELGDDPFQGGQERRIMPPTMTAADMEAAAAREAIARAGISKEDIGLVISYTLCPDYINVPQACVLHANLGLPERTLTFAVDAVCNSLIMQLSIAREQIANGRARFALLTQSSAITRLASSGEHYDTWFGDGATAIVVGPVGEGRGILGYAHRTDGTLHKALVCGVPGGRWFDAGAPVTYSEDHRANFDMVAKIADRAKQVIGESLAEAKLRPEEVDFYACHQAFLWLRRVTQKYCGLTQARAVDTFAWAGTVSAANLPLVLATGEREGLLRDGDVVQLFQGGTGMTWSGMVLRWGR